MKILCVCQRGNVRASGLAYILKDRDGHDALACGWETNFGETLEMLCEWADKIIVLESYFKNKIPIKNQGKVEIFDVGIDRWGTPTHPELLQILQNYR